MNPEPRARRPDSYREISAFVKNIETAMLTGQPVDQEWVFTQMRLCDLLHAYDKGDATERELLAALKGLQVQ